MGDPIGEVFFSPAESYDFKLSVKDVDYSNDLFYVRIVSSIASAYQIIILGIFVDPDEVILNKLYGQDPVKLSVILKGQTPEQKEQTDFELMCIRNMLDIASRPKFVNDEKLIGNVKDRSPVYLVTVCRQPFKSMTTLVNEVFMAQTLRQIITSLASTSGIDLKYDTEGENTEVIDQIIIPPTTFYKAIEYLDNTYGLFEGVPAAFCQFNNTLYVRNLSKTLNQSQTFTVYQLASLEVDEKVTEVLDGKTFYTYTPIKTGYSGNTLFATLAKNLHFVQRPRDTLYYIVDLDLSTICSTYSLPSAGKEIFIDSEMENRSRYYIDNTGYDTEETYAKSLIAKQVAALSTVSIDLERNLQILNLLNVGEAVKFNTKTLEYVPLAGKYILKSSDLVFRQAGSWESTARINLIRTHNLDK